MLPSTRIRGKAKHVLIRLILALIVPLKPVWRYAWRRLRMTTATRKIEVANQ
jgi:hypothetical protein